MQQSLPPPWAPLRFGVFRTLWLASLASNVGTWMQTVGAQWLLVHQPVDRLSDPPPQTSHLIAAAVST